MEIYFFVKISDIKDSNLPGIQAWYLKCDITSREAFCWIIIFVVWNQLFLMAY